MELFRVSINSVLLYAEGTKDMHCRLQSYFKGIGTKKGGGRITKTLQGKGRV